MLHIEKSGIQSGIDCFVEIFQGMLGQRNAGSRILGVVDQRVNAAECLRNLGHCGLDLSFLSAIGLNRENPDAIQALQLLLGILQFAQTPPGKSQVGSLLGKCGGHTVADTAALTAAGDNDGLTFKSSHCNHSCLFCSVCCLNNTIILCFSQVVTNWFG